MFKFLKEKLKSAVSKFSKDVDKSTEKVEEKPKVEKKKPKEKVKKEKKPVKEKKPKEEKPEPKLSEAQLGPISAKQKFGVEEKEVEEKKGLFKKIKEKLAKEEKEAEKKPEEEKPKEEAEEKAEKEKKTIFGRVKEAVTKKSLSEDKFNELFWELEVALLENNVAVEVIEKLKEDLKKELVDAKVLRGQVNEIVQETLQKSISDLFEEKPVDLLKEAKKKTPYVISFLGVNGSGKTTTIAKVAKLFQKNGLKVVLAASDTFRAAAIQQLEIHARNLGVKLIKHDYGADPAAVAFDAIKYAQAKNIDVVLIDTAGRQHSNVNLMDEMKKIIRVAKPDINIFIGESITGNDCIEQAKKFNEAVGIDAIILSKLDVDEKGGAAVSVSYITGKPIIYFGIGQQYEDLKKFEKKVVLEGLGF